MPDHEATRPVTYARIAMALRADPRRYGAHALFNQALTAALVEIAQREGVPKVVRALESGKYVPAATELSDVLVAEDAITQADRDVLVQAVSQTDPIRHGHERTRHLTDAEIDALCRLDAHDSLGVLGNIARDDDWVADQAAEAMEYAHAERHRDLIGDDEAQRRADAVKHIADPFGEPPQDCPVCDYTALLVQGGDDYGYGYGPGACVVCGYERSHAAGNHQGWLAEMQRHMERG